MKKNYFLKLHTILALISALPFLVICVTGSLLVFKPELDGLLHGSEHFVSPQGPEQRISLDVLAKLIENENPEFIIGSWEVFESGPIADRVYLIKKGTQEWYKLHLDPYSGVLLNLPVGITEYFTDWMLSLHYTFLLGITGAVFGGFFAVFMCLMGITGLILQRKFWRVLINRRSKKRWQVMLVDWHTFVGVVASPVLLVLGMTGGYWNIAGVLHELEHHVVEEPYYVQAPLYSSNISIQQLHDDSQQQIEGFTPTYLLFPYEPEMSFTVFGRVETPNPLLSDYSSTVTYDRTTGNKGSASDIREASVGVKFLDSFRHLHFGLFGGLFIRVLWCVIGAMPVFLMASGFYVWYTRAVKRKRAKKRRQQTKTAL